MLTILTMLLAGSAFAESLLSNGDPDYFTKSVERNCPDRPSSTPDMTHINDRACSPTKVDYTIVTLPDGQTASVLTFKD